jgi:hypothetical protein
MKRIFLFLIISLSCFSVFSQNHLEPIRPFDRTGYVDVLLESFVGNKSPELWMIVTPSSNLPYAIILYKNNGKYFLTSAEAKEEIWKFKKVGDHYALDLKPTKNVEFKSNSFELHELDEIINYWVTGLKLTRYAPERATGKDGTTYYFFSKGKLYGQTWSPKTGFTLDFVKLGEVLRQLSIKSIKDKSEMLIKAKELAIRVGG